MRGDERLQDGMFSYVTLEQRVPEDHPLREIRKLTDVVLRSLSGKFDELRAGLLQGHPPCASEAELRCLRSHRAGSGAFAPHRPWPPLRALALACPHPPIRTAQTTRLPLSRCD
jgi:hypothetical protein